MTFSPPRPVGARHGDRYQLLADLGRGGMGVVWRAYDRERGIQVALKELVHSTPAALVRFKREFRALADVAHPNLVTLYELFCDEQGWAFTMELLEDAVDFVDWVRGERCPAGATADLAPPVATVTRTRPLPDGAGSGPAPTPAAGFPTHAEPRLRAAFLQLVDGVGALHASGHLHRDLKSSNVLVTPAGRVVVLDFGIVARIADGGEPGELIGTPGYLAPEQAAGRSASAASDWYAAGVILHECLVGRRPFEGTAAAVLDSKQRWDAVAPGALVADLPDDLDRLCRELLARRPDDRPSGPDLKVRLTGGRSSAPASTLQSAGQVIGRDAELTLLEEALASATTTGVIAYVHGPSGVGKTALVRAFLDRPRAPAALVLAGRCYERELVPYRAVDSLVDAIADHLSRRSAAELGSLLPDGFGDLARMFPALAGVPAIADALRDAGAPKDPVEARRSAAMAFRELIARLAHGQPTVIFIDDVHWGDVDSALLLDVLMRPPAPPLLVVACYRTDQADGSALLKTLFRRRQRLGPAVSERHIALGGLDVAAAMTLVSRLVGDRPLADDTARQLASGVEGNPFFLQRLVRHAISAAGGSMPTVDQAFAAHLRALEGDVRAVLEVIALNAAPLPQSVAQQAVGLPTTRWLAVVHTLRAEHLVRSSGLGADDLIEPDHDRIREAIARALDEPTRRAHHLALAHAFESRDDATADGLARHYMGAGDTASAARHARRAGDDAVRALAFDRAASFYQIALDHCDGGEAASELRIKVGEALINAGRGADGAHLLLAAAGDQSGSAAIDLRRRAAEQLLRSGRIDDGMRELAGVLAAVGLRFPRSALRAVPGMLWQRFRAWLHGLRVRERSPVPADLAFRADVCLSAAIGLGLIDPARAAAFCARALVLAQRCGDARRLARAVAIEAGFRAGERNPAASRRLLARARELVEETGDEQARGLLLVSTCVAHYEWAEWQACLSAAEGAEAYLRQHGTGVAWELQSVQVFVVGSWFYLGNVVRLAEDAERCFAEAEQRGNLFAMTSLGALMLPSAHLGTGDLDRARAEVDRAAAGWTYQGESLQRVWISFLRAFCHLYDGNPAAADRQCCEAAPEIRRTLIGFDRALGNMWRYLQASAALAADNRSGTRRRHRWVLRVARRLWRDGASTYRAMALVLRAGVAAARGRTAKAVAHLEAAAAHFESAGAELFAAMASRRAGELTGDQARIDQVDQRMRSLGVACPEQLSDALVLQPGAPDHSVAATAGVPRKPAK